MATRRERNNLASKKSYERALERTHATDYEFVVVERHRTQTGDEAWHWSVIPEDHLFEAGYIHDFAKHRLMRLMNKKRMEEGENRLRDYGLDGLARGVTGTGEVVYHGLQAKYYTSRSVTAEDIGSFFAKQISMTLANPLSRGYLYTTTRLQADLADEVAQPTYPIRHVLYPWKHPDRRLEPVVAYQEEVLECDLPLRDYQVEVLAGLVDGRNAVCIPCRMGKTLIAGHWTRRLRPSVVIAIAPLKVSVENLRERLACFLPGHAPLLVDSDAGGTTDEKEIEAFLERTAKGESVVIYSTFQSAEDVLARWEWEEDTVLLVDEAHNVIGRDTLCEWIQGFRRCLAMSATFPEEVEEAMGMEHKVVVPFSKGIEGGYIVDYTLWLPSLTKHKDGSTSVEAEIPVGFEEYERSMVLKALYHAVCMLRTGSRRTIVYLGSQADCDEYMAICRRVLEEYHGITEVWMGKITSDVTNSKERKAILKEFQEGEAGSFRILTSVRILDEAVDIPSCDSVFITTVGEKSSDIRFFQRAQRSGTLDPKNPMKRNNIFLWAEGWERCVGALSLLREADPEFHAKVRHAGTRYDEKETVSGRAERVARERVEFTEWSRMACETVEERVRRKCRVLLEFVEREGRVPKQTEIVEGVRIGSYWNRVTQRDCEPAYHEYLCHNPVLREHYERVGRLKEEKKGKPVLTPEDKAMRLLVFVEKEGRPPKRSEEGSVFWESILNGQSKRVYDTILSYNPHLKGRYEQFNRNREAKKEDVVLTPEQKAEQLLLFVEKEGRVPKVSETWGEFWRNIRTKGTNQDLYINKLSQHPVLQQDYEHSRIKRASRKDNHVLTPEEKARQLVQFVEKEGRIPSQKQVCGKFWYTILRQGNHKMLYTTILSKIPILEQNYIQYHEAKKKEKTEKNALEKAEILLKYVESVNRKPKTTDVVDGLRLGEWWVTVVKQGASKKAYNTILSKNKILKEDYEKGQDNKKSKGGDKYTLHQKSKLLLEFIEKEKRLPKKREVVGNFNIGQYLHNMKNIENPSKQYMTLLSTNPILKADYDRVQLLRQQKQNDT